jgi:hypothetical protein
MLSIAPAFRMPLQQRHRQLVRIFADALFGAAEATRLTVPFIARVEQHQLELG